MKHIKRIDEIVPIITCGIYLFDSNNKLLIQHPTNFRATVWGVPKGRFDQGETSVFEVCKRELQEETGIRLDDYTIIYKEELEVAQYNATNKFLKSFFVKIDKDLSQFPLQCSSWVYRNGKPSFLEVDEWKWVSIEEADKIFSADRMSAFQDKNIKRCREILSGSINEMIDPEIEYDFRMQSWPTKSHTGDTYYDSIMDSFGYLTTEFVVRSLPQNQFILQTDKLSKNKNPDFVQELKDSIHRLGSYPELSILFLIVVVEGKVQSFDSPKRVVGVIEHMPNLLQFSLRIHIMIRKNNSLLILPEY